MCQKALICSKGLRHSGGLLCNLIANIEQNTVQAVHSVIAFALCALHAFISFFFLFSFWFYFFVGLNLKPDKNSERLLFA